MMRNKDNDERNRKRQEAEQAVAAVTLDDVDADRRRTILQCERIRAAQQAQRNTLPHGSRFA